MKLVLFPAWGQLLRASFLPVLVSAVALLVHSVTSVTFLAAIVLLSLLAASLSGGALRLVRLAAELKLLSLGHTPAWSLSALETLSLHLL